MNLNYFFIGLLFFCINAVTQELPMPLSIQSPNAACIAKYGDVPVSYFTGQPNIDIPIHSIKVRGIEMNVSLSYDASGIRIDNHPGWVGQNWTLNTGGVITRSIQGMMDEFNTIGTGLPESAELGFMYQCGQLSDALVDSDNELVNLANNNQWGYDYQPDIFTFNFMGKAGKFFLDNDGNWKVLSDHNLKIVFDDSNIIMPMGFDWMPGCSYHFPKVIGGFQIIDDEGNTYYFGNNGSANSLNAIEYSIAFFEQLYPCGYWKSNAWHLTKVVDRFGMELFSLSYERGDYIAQFYRSTGKTVQSTVPDGNGGFLFNAFSANTSVGCYDVISNNSDNVEGELISPVYLTTIYSQPINSTINFNIEETNELKYNYLDLDYKVRDIFNALCPSGSTCVPNPFYYLSTPYSAQDIVNSLKWYKLTSINVDTKNIQFIYNNNPSQRLNLTELRIVATEAYSYKFYYNSFQSIPGYLSKKVDHWGYNRGADYSIPNDLSLYYNQRTSNASYLTVGMLNKVVYPTGGYSTFEYEPHTFFKIVNDARTGFYNESGIAGGVRIKTIIDFDGRQNLTRNFYYVLDYEINSNSNTSSGILSYKPKYYWPNWSLKAKSGEVLTQTIFAINSLIPLSNSFGTHIGYTEVVEKRSDGSYTIYKYSNFDNTCFDDPPIKTLNINSSPYDKISDLSIIKGKPIHTEIYNVNNNLVRSISYNYRPDVSSLKTNTQFYSIGCNAQLQNTCPNTSTSVYYGGAYKLYYFDYDIIEETVTDILAGNSITKSTNYTKSDLIVYGSNIRLTNSIKESGSDGSVTKTMRYPADFPDYNIARTMLKRNMLNTPLEIITTENSLTTHSIINQFSCNNATNILLRSSNWPYLFIIIKPLNLATAAEIRDCIFLDGTILATQKNELEINAPITNYSQASAYFDNFDYRMKPSITFDAFDYFGNLLQYHTPNNPYVAYRWSYNNIYPYVEATNTTSSALITADANAKVAAGISDMSSITQPSLNTGQFNQLKLYNTNLRSGSLSSAMITTYTYHPRLGITSSTDENNITTYYEYDGFGRLIRIKDQDLNVLKQYEYNYAD